VMRYGYDDVQDESNTAQTKTTSAGLILYRS
jgi:hypothetical protein